ncbi:MAG TPA: bacteriohopanetetrol glucosamine biosynthesis glycosyltransferase HpnI [Sphingomonas sp.]
MLAAVFSFLSAIGIAYTLAAALVAGRWRAPAPPLPTDPPAVTLLKPLHGAEPRLAENLAGFAAQDYPAPVQIVCGVADDGDPALAAARAIGADIVIDATRHGANAKVSNLINMAARARHPLIVLSDSDMAVAPDYLARIADAMARPGVGAVTCLYAGRGDAGGWSRLAAAGISWQFLPSVMIGLACRMARPCMGSTIALTSDTLARIGGFRRFADLLADDHAIGAAVRALGLEVAVPPMILAHGCDEPSLAAIVRHELRWQATVRMLDPAGYAGSAVTHVLPFALLAGMAGGGWGWLGGALLARLALAARIDTIVGARTAPLWWLPARDMLSFGLYCAAFFTRRVDWRGARLHMAHDGRMTADVETRDP